MHKKEYSIELIILAKDYGNFFKKLSILKILESIIQIKNK